jgi:hypothetical protein
MCNSKYGYSLPDGLVVYNGWFRMGFANLERK